MKKYIIILYIFLFTHLGISSDIDPLCGPKSLLRICEYYNTPVSLEEICNLSNYQQSYGTSMYNLFKAANLIGLPVVPVDIEFKQLCKTSNPSIAFVDGNHFIVVHGFTLRKVKIQNPPDKPYYISKKEFKKRWSGKTLVFSKKLKKQMAHEITIKNASTREPCILFHETNKYFGSVDEGDTLSYTFNFTNIGTDTLKVYIRSSCGCVNTLLTKKNILPSERGKIDLTYFTKGGNGLTFKGIDVRTNDPSNKWVKLTISATILSSGKIASDKL